MSNPQRTLLYLVKPERFAALNQLTTPLEHLTTLCRIVPEAATSPGRETGGSQSRPDQGVGHQQAQRAGAAEPAAEGAKRPL